MRHRIDEPREDDHPASATMMNCDATGIRIALERRIAWGITPMTHEEAEWVRHSVESSPAWVLAQAAIGFAVIAYFSSGSLPATLSIRPYAISAYQNH